MACEVISIISLNTNVHVHVQQRANDITLSESQKQSPTIASITEYFYLISHNLTILFYRLTQ